ncbi:MAG: 2-amino-4-hydroxy-6-hydroxymethyldihydropteridine diphosphokinase [Brevefilum sp.]|nr:2-amino-4-hydroxy-6-hydroxymethyldihydropteridine diphosphokinase [Brevefilum sp.]MDT8382678.1 2-amino-4-hydroxy-6-hydroxymethyldihydropteridine diphosphokinase [Brevefilum sp.]MDW7754925.1 2-amino-4-hydroxy-6-hydroxymethyldihydropteridine diphosphokinase [Brevefilum sp.]
MNEQVFLALGTNIGDRETNLCEARKALGVKVTIIKESPIYITPPWGYEDQPEFLNQVLELRTKMRPGRLLAYVKRIEKKMGRLKTFRNGPRLIDLDILFYGQRVIKRSKLRIPHPSLHERNFVLVPLKDIAPEFNHPVLNMTVETMLAKINTEGVRPL